MCSLNYADKIDELKQDVQAKYPRQVFIKGLNSCPMRRQKLQQYRHFLTANGHEIVDNPRNSDVILLWTCAFRGDYRDNSISEIQRYQREYGSELIVAGCLPDIAPELLKENFPGRVINWRDDEEKMKFFGRKAELSQVPLIYTEKKLCDDASKYRKENDKDATFQDQFLKLVVSEGCGFKCTYCSERLAFPPFHSFPEDELVEACRRAVEETGQLEVILLADNLGAYGSDISSSLPQLIHKLKGIHPDLKLALSNLNPAYFIKYYDDMVGFLHNGDIRHLNLPIQSASASILKSMNRPYTRDDIDKSFGLLNSIGFTEFDTHIIVGFPGETEEDFEETVQFILRHRPRYVLSSGFMESPAAAASRLPHKVDEETKRQRLHNAGARLRSVNIICNVDGDTADRLRRLNYLDRGGNYGEAQV